MYVPIIESQRKHFDLGIQSLCISVQKARTMPPLWMPERVVPTGSILASWMDWANWIRLCVDTWSSIISRYRYGRDTSICISHYKRPKTSAQMLSKLHKIFSCMTCCLETPRTIQVATTEVSTRWCQKLAILLDIIMAQPYNSKSTRLD